MLKFLTTISIPRRLFCTFLLAILFPCVVIFLLDFNFIAIQKNRSAVIETDIQAYTTANDTSRDISHMMLLLEDAYQRQYDVTGIDQLELVNDQTQLHDIVVRIDQNIKHYQQEYQLTTSPQMSDSETILRTDDPATKLPEQQQAILDQVITRAWPDYQQAQNQVLTAMEGKVTRGQAQTLLTAASNKHAALEDAWGQVVKISQEVDEGVAKVELLQRNSILLATFLAVASTMIIVGALCSIVYLSITRPLRQLVLFGDLLAKGETYIRTPVEGKDEIAQLATAFNIMQDTIVQLMHETEAQQETIQTQVEKLVSEVSGVGEGDLRVQAEVTADTLGILADSFNYMIEELSSLVVRVKVVSREVAGSTSAILMHMNQLVEAGSVELQHIAEVSAEVEQMTTSNQEVAERAKVLAEVAHVARQDAQNGREAVQQAIAGMGRINEHVNGTASKVQTLGERSLEIDEIVEAISGISHQTNRLALDAAIQAAMAGEHGKGFGAVAVDIRRLAEKAKEQAGMITRIVRTIREDIDAVASSMRATERETATGTQLTQEAGTALESIFVAVEHQAREIEHINEMTAKQLQSSKTVAGIIADIKTSMRQSNSNINNASQNMERLMHLVEQLRSSVEAFKLRENQGYVIPTTNVKPIHENETESPLTVSGIFRKVSVAQLKGGNIAMPQVTGSFRPVTIARSSQASSWGTKTKSRPEL